MLNNLKAELVRKELKPESAVTSALSCCPKTEKAKLEGKRDFTVPEAFKILNTYFTDENLSLEYLFKNDTKSA